METSCNLEVVINGQYSFWVNKSILSPFCGKLSTLKGNNIPKVTFQDFPNGPHGFELITRFCYNKGKIEITHSNILILNNVAIYMQMGTNPYGKPSLLAQTKDFLQGFDFWTWSELLNSLKRAPTRSLSMDFYASHAQNVLVEELVRRVALLAADPSSKCTSFRSSCDSGVTASTETRRISKGCWFFDDLSVLEIGVMEMVVSRMIIANFEHSSIGKLLLCYQRSRLFGAKGNDEKVRILQGVINLFSSLNKRCIPIKGLFHTLREASHLKLSKGCMRKLELLVGAQMDQATVDDLLIRSQSGQGCAYDVNMVVRLLRIFLLDDERRWRLLPLKRVGRIMDLYAMEIAPDVFLKPSKFAAVVLALPDSARDSCDGIYRAIDMYLEVHPRISDRDRTRIASVLNYNKLSAEVVIHLAQNTNFPTAARFRALIYQDLKVNNASKCVYDHLKMVVKWWGYGFNKKQVVEYVNTRDERVRKQHPQLPSKFCCSKDALYLPRLCS